MTSLKERLEEVMFVSCPTEEKEPFFWRWTDSGKETLLDFIEQERQTAIAEERERVRNIAITHTFLGTGKFPPEYAGETYAVIKLSDLTPNNNQ